MARVLAPRHLAGIGGEVRTRDMVVDAQLGAAAAGKERLGLIGAGLAVGTAVLMIDALRQGYISIGFDHTYSSAPHLDSRRTFPLRSHMRLSSYPYVIVRVACSRCPRQGQYRLARLADRYGSEAAMNSVLTMLSADCKLAERGRLGIDRFGAFFPDLGGARPPDESRQAQPRGGDPPSR